jgi:hypothetical protein
VRTGGRIGGQELTRRLAPRPRARPGPGTSAS